MKENRSPNIIFFLGLCERAAYVRDGNTTLFKWNILGLKQIMLSHIFPSKLTGLTMGFVLPSASRQDPLKIRITDGAGNEIGRLNLTVETVASQDAINAKPKEKKVTTVHPILEHGWVTVFFRLEGPDIVIPGPGSYYLNQVWEDGEKLIGQFDFVLVNPPPLTPERVAAIRSDPNAAKAVKIELGCTHCPSKCRGYASLDRKENFEKEGWAWYEDLPEVFVCECGSTRMDLHILRRNLHGILGQIHLDISDLSFVPLYEKGSIDDIQTDFLHLLKSDPKEELLHQFIDQNPILLHQFPAERIFSKPPILTSFVADFAIITSQKELILIELEKTTTRLMKKDGGIAAPLSHALDQVRSWLHVVDEHRLAVLDSLKIERNEVSAVRGIVVAGREAGYDAQHIRRLKGMDLGRISLLTYDDLLFALNTLGDHLHRL